ncbi:MAG: hemerythrin domain-containing protein [Catenulispora sp.]
MREAEHGDVVTELVRDHRVIQGVFAELEQPAGRLPERRADLVSRAILELVRHSVAEELVLFPALRQYVPDGGALVDLCASRHAAAEELMRDLAPHSVGDPGFEDGLAALLAATERHIYEQEHEVFPTLAAVCGPRQLTELGGRVAAIKRVAPAESRPETSSMRT